MATNFPTSIDTNPGDPTGNETLYAVDHASLHSFVQDAVVAIETYLGAIGSAVTTSITYLVHHVLPTMGGTGIYSYVKGQILAATNSTTLAALNVGTDGYVLTSDSTQPTGLSWKAQLIPAGAEMGFAGSSVPSGWLAEDGSAVSRTTYAALFAAIGTTWGAGDGSTTFNLPDSRGRVMVGAGTGQKVATFVSRASNVITVSGVTNNANNEFQTGDAVLYLTTSGQITGLTNNTTYYVIRISNTSFSLATSLANAQNGTVISLSSDGSGVQTFTLTLTARTLGETGGEENHAMSITELLAHSHLSNNVVGGSRTSTNGAPSSTSATGGGPTDSVGGNVAMNNMQPFGVHTMIIKT